MPCSWSFFFGMTASVLLHAVQCSYVFTDHFSGPGRAIGLECVCLCQDNIFKLNDLRPRYLAYWLIFTLERSNSNVTVIGHKFTVVR